LSSYAYNNLHSMRTTVDIPSELFQKAYKFHKKDSKKSLLIKGLNLLIEKSSCDTLLKWEGGIDIVKKIDLDNLRNRKSYSMK